MTKSKAKRRRERDGLSGSTGGIPWTRMEVEGQEVKVPHGARQFVVASQGDTHVVVRVHTLAPVPPDDVRGWMSVHAQLGPALKEALAREDVWLALALEMLGKATVDTYQPRAPTLFERRAYENRQNPRYMERRSRELGSG